MIVDGKKLARVEYIKQNAIPLSQIEPATQSNQLVKGWLTEGGLSVIYGPSNAGKTFVAADLAMHIAAGAPWRGYRVKQGNVVYVAAEGGAGIRNRLAAQKVERPDLTQHDNFTLIPLALDLHGEADAECICAAIPYEETALIVIDTLARSIGSGDENSAKDMSVFIANLDLIREATKAAVLVVHHSGKTIEAGARGSSALRAAVDTEIFVSAARSITCQKQRDLQYPAPLYFDLQHVELGFDEWGDPITSTLVVEVDAPATKTKPLTGGAQVAMQALDEALRKHGEKKRGEDFPSDRLVVHKSHWRAACDAHGLSSGASDAASRTAFNRNKTRLMDMDEIRMYLDYVWKVHSGD